jgi:hypothetical protein
MPKKRQLKELEEVYFQTNNALDLLLKKNGLKILKDYNENQDLNEMNLEQLRRKMADDHNAKVSRLVAAIGKEKAIPESRKKLFEVGVRLGEKARLELGVRDSISDILKAAKILYKILGINFQTKRLKNNEVVMFVNQCNLSKYYNENTCRILSAADEGVVQGLNPNYKMKFQERITSGATKCKAEIRIMG